MFYNNRESLLLTVRSGRVPVAFGICAMIDDDNDDLDCDDGDENDVADDEIEILNDGGDSNNKVITHIENNMVFEYCNKYDLKNK